MHRPALTISALVIFLTFGLLVASGPMLAADESGAGIDVSLGESGVDESNDELEVTGMLESSTERHHLESRTYLNTREFDTTTYTITVHSNGDATWTFRHERILSSSDEESQFEAFAEEFEDEETELYTDFVNQAEALTELGSDVTDREMAATDFNRSATIEQRFNTRGVVEMSFTWEGFAVVSDDEIIVGDVFDGGYYITSEQTLVIEADDGLTFTSAQPDGQVTGASLEDSNSITWSGSKQFLDGQPRVVLERSGSSESSGTSSSLSENLGNSPSSWLLGAILVVFIAAVSVGVYRYRQDSSSAPATETESENEAMAASPDGPQTAAADPITDAELLSDEDRVVSLIRENGGRMKQVNIVDETGWSKSKVSMLLSEMESEGTISKLRVGRENIISLDGFEPEAARSPFEE
ncbi:helix-turn-helix transcriptional regulator [Natrialbaceae archaeon A-CW2]